MWGEGIFKASSSVSMYMLLGSMPRGPGHLYRSSSTSWSAAAIIVVVSYGNRVIAPPAGTLPCKCSESALGKYKLPNFTSFLYLLFLSTLGPSASPLTPPWDWEIGAGFPWWQCGKCELCQESWACLRHHLHGLRQVTHPVQASLSSAFQYGQSYWP